MSARIVVVGSSNTDMVVKAPRIPAPGETILGGQFVMTPGGKGANQAVAAARLGAHVTFVGRVGADVFGEEALRNIEAAGVDTRFVVRDPEAPSGVALIAVDSGGQNSIVVAPGANGRLTHDDVERARPAFAAADVVVLQLEIPVETVARAVSLARELSKTVVLNPAPVQTLPDGLLRGVDVLTPNEHEAARLLGEDLDGTFDGVRAARGLLQSGVGAAVVTLGPNGAVAVTGSQVHLIPARRVQPVDTTAAGDCFTGALAVALGEGRDLAAASHFAAAAAALSVTRFGAQASMPHRQEVESFTSTAA